MSSRVGEMVHEELEPFIILGSRGFFPKKLWERFGKTKRVDVTTNM